MNLTRAEAREIIDSLKSGTTPLGAAHHLDVGRDRWYREMKYYLEQAAEVGESKVRFIRGSYGDGKTHLMGMAQHDALTDGFVVSYASAVNTPLHKFEEVYKRVIRNLATAKTSNGIQSILRSWKEQAGEDLESAVKQLRSIDALDINFRIAVEYYLRERDSQHEDMIVQWLIGEPVKLPDIGIKRIIRAGDSRDMMRSLSVFLRLIGFKGLLVLLDELDRIQSQSTRIRSNCYQVLRELMDNADGQGGMQGTIFYCAAPPEMFTGGRGFMEYPALQSRLEVANSASGLGNSTEAKRVDYRATIINLEDTPLQISDYVQLAIKIREIHSIAHEWEAVRSLPDSKLDESVRQIAAKHLDISTPRLVATAIATIMELAEQGQEYDLDQETSKAYDVAQDARKRQHQLYED